MHPADINAALLKKGTNQTIVAESLNVTHVAVSHVIHGRSSSKKIAAAISKATGISLDRLWPGRYPRQTRQKLAVAA